MKKFVPLHSKTKSPSTNPNEVTTYTGANTSIQPEWHVDLPRARRTCKPPDPKKPRVITIEEELRLLQQKAKDFRYQRPARRRCMSDDLFQMCIATQRRPPELIAHAATRENLIASVHEELQMRRHDARTRQIPSKKEKARAMEEPEMPCDQRGRPPLPRSAGPPPLVVVRLASPMLVRDEDEGGDQEAADEVEDGAEEREEVGAVTPIVASPADSVQAVYEPTNKMLASNRPKSRMFHNESIEPPMPPGLPILGAEGVDNQLDYRSYNPRQLQEKFDAQNLKSVPLITGDCPQDLWTFNIGLQERESDLDKMVGDAKQAPFDVNRPELIWYEIPDDLHKTFVGQFVYGDLSVSSPPVRKGKIHYLIQPPEIASIYVAYVETFRTPPDYWTNERLNEIILAGKKLHKRSVDTNYKSPDLDFDIIPQLTDRKAIVGLKLHYKSIVKGNTNLYQALTLYFNEYDVAILSVANTPLYLLIWKRCSTTFYIYDPRGRDVEGHRDTKYTENSGASSLIVTQHVEHVMHLILHFSGVQLDDEFALYEIYPINMGKITDPIDLAPQPKMTRRRWRIVNEHFAIVPSSIPGYPQPSSRSEKPQVEMRVRASLMGLPPTPAAKPKVKSEQNPSMLASLLAIFYADIECAFDWRPEVLDEILKWAKNQNTLLLKRLKLKKSEFVHISDMPDKIVLGVYRAMSATRPFLFTGQVVAENECPKYRETALVRAIHRLFAPNSEWKAGLLQMDGSTIMALFRDHKWFYVFDPFRRTRVGLVVPTADVLEKASACLHIHSTLDSLCRIVYRLVVALPVGDKFMLHGFNVLSIRPLYELRNHKNRYPGLKLDLPAYLTPSLTSGEAQEDTRRKSKAASKKMVRRFSIPRLPSDEHIPIYTDEEMAAELIEELILSVLNLLQDPMPPRERVYPEADKVLLHTDREYLELLRHQVAHHEDESDNVVTAEHHRICPDPEKRAMTLDEELLVPSNYVMLPDNAWVIFGESLLKSSAEAECENILPAEDEEKRIGLLSALVCAALSLKYKVSTWNSALVEYAITAVSGFDQPSLRTYAQLLPQLLSRQVPRIAIGENLYEIKVTKIVHSSQNGGSRPLRETLLQSLFDYSQLLVICQRFGCLIIRRYNFLYMFVGYACNAIGYRCFRPGKACMLRFAELSALLRRIEMGCNPTGCNVDHYAVCGLETRDVPQHRYYEWPPGDAAEVQYDAKMRRRMARENQWGKLTFLDDELRKEYERIDAFAKQKRLREEQRHTRRRPPPKQSKKKVLSIDSQTTLRPDEAGEEEAQTEEEEDIAESRQDGSDGAASLLSMAELQHLPGRQLPVDLEPYFKTRPIAYGYRLRAGECVYKIQGSMALEGRAEESLDGIKPCFFASAVALMYALVRPLREWSEQRVDRVIETAKVIASRTVSLARVKERRIENLLVDDYEFNVIVRTFTPPGVNKPDILLRIAKITKMRKYVLMQISNCTYGIYHDELYHLFDPYGNMELTGEENEAEEDDDEAQCSQTGIKRPRFGERNTASWVLFIDIETMLEHIDKRAVNPDWRNSGNYNFYIIDILSHRRLAERSRLLRLMDDRSVAPSTCRATREAVADPLSAGICTNNESLSWVPTDPNCYPVWSRLNRRNSDGHYRNLPLTRLRQYDVEISGRLWSLWGGLHPSAAVFDESSRGRQFLACCVVACCAAHVYPLLEWSPQLLDSIVISGDRYHRESLARINFMDYEFSLEDLNLNCALGNLKFRVHMEHVAFGVLYIVPTVTHMNLSEALMFFFTRHHFGIIQCPARKRVLAFGRTNGHAGGYFLFDCQDHDGPVFPRGQGGAYLLRTRHLQVLLYCAVVALAVPHYNVVFSIHKVDVVREEVAAAEDEKTAANDDNTQE